MRMVSLQVCRRAGMAGMDLTIGSICLLVNYFLWVLACCDAIKNWRGGRQGDALLGRLLAGRHRSYRDLVRVFGVVVQAAMKYEPHGGWALLILSVVTMVYLLVRYLLGALRTGIW
jgi:hypothetical protein